MDCAIRFEPPGLGKKHQIRTFQVGSAASYLVLPVGLRGLSMGYINMNMAIHEVSLPLPLP